MSSYEELIWSRIPRGPFIKNERLKIPKKMTDENDISLRDIAILTILSRYLTEAEQSNLRTLPIEKLEPTAKLLSRSPRTQFRLTIVQIQLAIEEFCSKYNSCSLRECQEKAIETQRLLNIKNIKDIEARKKQKIASK